MNTQTHITTGSNCATVTLGRLTVWFSYSTPIAFQVEGSRRVVRVNDWAQTTGKHLNAIDGGDKASRVSGEAFEKALAAALP